MSCGTLNLDNLGLDDQDIAPLIYSLEVKFELR